MANKQDSYVFISYSSKNRVLARELYDVLTKRHHITCWFDINDILIDEAVFQEHILRAIRNASALIWIETEAGRQSDYVLRELATAQENAIPIFRYGLPEDQLQIGVVDGAIVSEQPPEGHAIQKWIKQIRIAFLAARIKLRISQPFWVATLTLIVIILALGYGIFALSKAVTPIAVDAIERVVLNSGPEDKFPIETADTPDPKTIAPFHFDPKSPLLSDDFDQDGFLDEAVYHYDIEPSYEEVTITQQEGVLVLNYPTYCLYAENSYDCETEIGTDLFEIEDIQYFAIRLRSLENSTFKELSFSISTTSAERRRTGFGWALSDHITPFYRANKLLPETDFYAHIPLDDQWHAYEIILDPDETRLLYYLDGQLINTTQMNYFEEWENAPLKFMIYQTGNSVDEWTTEGLSETHIEVDQVIVGGF